MSAQPAQAELFEPCNGWATVALPAGEKARWREESDGIIRLEVGGQSHRVTRERCGRQGKDRFYVAGIRNRNGGAVQARGMAYLARNVAALLKWKENTEARLARIEKKVGIAATKSKSRAAAKLEVGDDVAKDAFREKRYFNPFIVDWRSTKQFFQIPDWVTRSPLSPIAQIVYSRLLFPLAGADGFCDRFDKRLGVVFGLNCAALAKHLGKDQPDYIERVVKTLCEMESPCIELHGKQGQTKTVRYLRTKWMTADWLLLCKDTSDKKSEEGGGTSDNITEVQGELPTKSRKFPLTKRISVNESPKNESARGAVAHRGQSPPADTGTRALSSNGTRLSDAVRQSLGIETKPQERKPRKKASGEDDFMRRLADIDAREAVENGGIWRTAYRAEPNVLHEALGELAVQWKQGHKPKTTWGAWLNYFVTTIRDERK